MFLDYSALHAERDATGENSQRGAPLLPRAHFIVYAFSTEIETIYCSDRVLLFGEIKEVARWPVGKLKVFTVSQQFDRQHRGKS
jgi:hypothetical protein